MGTASGSMMGEVEVEWLVSVRLEMFDIGFSSEIIFISEFDCGMAFDFSILCGYCLFSASQRFFSNCEKTCN